MELIWYLADLVIEIQVEGEERNAVQFDLHLIRARSGEEAYDKALRIGGAKAHKYLRSDGNVISFVFRGLNDLVAVDEDFSDGARLLFRSQSAMEEEEIRNVVTPKEYLRAIQAEATSDEGGVVQ